MFFTEKIAEVGYGDLNGYEKKYYKKIYQAIQNGSVSAVLSGLFEMDVLERIVTALSYDHIELFYVDFKHIFCTASARGMVYHIPYTVRPEMRNIWQQNMKRWVESAIRQMQITEKEPAFNIYRKVHNYLVRNVSYDYEAFQNPDQYPEAFHIGGVLSKRKAVCEGISKVFKLLCNCAGAENVYIMEGQSLQENEGKPIPHVWNVVKAEALYSHIDVTWDLCFSAAGRQNRYDYFMIPDDWMRLDHIYTGRFECRTGELTYFVQEKCLITNVKELSAFVQRELERKKPVLYFKIVSKNGFPKDIDSRVQELVQSMVVQYAEDGYSLEMLPNKTQHIFFYKVKY